MNSSIRNLRQAKYFDCTICLQQYNSLQRFPMIICIGQHCVCNSCAQSFLFKFSDRSVCPECKRQIEKRNMIKFRYLQQIKRTAESVQNQGSVIRRMSANETQTRNRLAQEIQKNHWLMKQVQQKQTIIHKFKEQNNSLLSEVEGWKFQVDQLQTINDELNQQLKQFQQDLGQAIQQTTSSPYKYSPILAYSWVDNESYAYQNMNISGFIITAKKGVDVFSRNVINKSKRFSVHFLQMKEGAFVGVIDSSYKKLQNILQKPNHIMISSQGALWDGATRQKTSFVFKTYQSIQIQVDLQSGTIKWISEEQKVQKKINSLTNKKIAWVPYLSLPYANDKATICQ